MQSNKIGIDIASESFMVARRDVSQKKGFSTVCFENEEQGISQFINTLQPEDHCIVEGTGVYHLQLCYSLVSAGKKVTVVNPSNSRYEIKI
jgi:transposase